MIIVFFARLFYPHIGGVEKHVFKISKKLIKKGHKIIVVTEELAGDGFKNSAFSHYGKEILKQVQNDRLDSRQARLADAMAKRARMTGDIEIYRIPVGRNEWLKKFRIWWWLWQHRRLIQKTDLVHCHDVFFWYLPFRFLYPKKPVYTTFHGYEGDSLPSKKAIFMHKISEKLSFGNICVGDFLKKWYGTKPNYVTYGGIDFMKTQNLKLKTQNYNSKLKTLLKIAFVGRLEEETGIMEYLRAVKIQKEKGYKIRLDVLGDGALRKKAEAFCFRNGLNVKFHGFVENVGKFLAQSSLVFTSRYLGILESMNYRKLIFAVYNNDIKKDYLSIAPFSNFIVIVSSKEEIFSKFVYFLKHPEKEKEIVNKAFKWVRMQSWDKVAMLYLDLWRGRR